MTPEQRSVAFSLVARSQPGCSPYDNHRTINVRERTAGQTLRELLSALRPYDGEAERLAEHHEAGWIRIDGKVHPLDRKLVAGNVISLVLTDTVEPAIAQGLRVIHEDAALIVIDKPAPLPMHPCGRYNKNSFTSLAAQAWPDLTVKLVHRLDANTTGIMVLAKTVEAARELGKQFTEHRVGKSYVARVHGVPKEANFEVNASIEREPSIAGTRDLNERGRVAVTTFELIEPMADGTSLVTAYPKTGRTNQIRLHLRLAGHPIVGDKPYGHDPDLQGGLTRDEERLFLHASELRFAHPDTREPVCFEAPLPDGFRSDAAGTSTAAT